MKSERGKRPDNQLFEHADRVFFGRNDLHDHLHMQVFHRQRIDRFQVDVFAFDPERAVMHAVPPNGMGVAEPFHVKPAKRFEGDLFRRALQRKRQRAAIGPARASGQPGTHRACAFSQFSG